MSSSQKSNFNVIFKYRRCRMCLAELIDGDKSLYDDDNYLLKRFKKCFHAPNVSLFQFTKQLAGVCNFCAHRLLDFEKFQSKGRKNMRRLETHPDYLNRKCLICLVPYDLTNMHQKHYSLLEGDCSLAKKFGKCFNVPNIDQLDDTKHCDKICELCKIKLDEFDMIRSTVRKYDIEFFGDPHSKNGL